MPRRAFAPGSTLGVLFAIAVALRIGWQIRVGFYVHPETWEYDAVARSLANGHGYGYLFLGTEWHTFATPAYPLLLCALHLLSGGPDSYLLIGVAQAFMSAGLTLTSYGIADRLRGPGAGIVAAAVVAFHPALIIYAAKVHELSFEALLASWALLAAIVAVQDRSRRLTVALGMSAGLAALTRPTLAFVSAVDFAALLRWRPRRPIAFGILLTVAILAPWTIRNASLLGRGAPASPYTCVILWMGNSPVASGGTLARDGRGVLQEIPPKLHVEGRPEADQGRILCGAAMGWISANLGREVRWWAEKVTYFWWFPPEAGQWYPPTWIDAYRPAYALEALLALLGVVLTIRRAGRRAALLLVVVQLVVVSVTQSFFYVDGRHRLLLEPTLAALASIGIATIATAARRLRTR